MRAPRTLDLTRREISIANRGCVTVRGPRGAIGSHRMCMGDFDGTPRSQIEISYDVPRGGDDPMTTGSSVNGSSRIGKCKWARGRMRYMYVRPNDTMVVD